VQIRGIVDRATNEVCRVAVDPNSAPGQIVGHRSAEIVGRRLEHLSKLALSESLMKRQNSVRAAGLDEMEDGRIVGEIRYRRQDHDE